MHKSSPRALVIACVALVAAIGGTSYAAVKLPSGGGVAGQVQQDGAVPDVAPAASQVSGQKATAAKAGMPGQQVDRQDARQQSEGIAGTRDSARSTSSDLPEGTNGIAGRAPAEPTGLAGAK